MAQVLYKHADLWSDLQHPCENQAWFYNSSAWGKEQADPNL